MSPSDPPPVEPPARDALATLLDAGIELLQQEGLGHGAERISLERAAAHAGVARATAYRLWKHATVRPQEAFQTALLCRLSEDLVRQDDEATDAADSVALLFQQLGPIDQMNPAERWATLIEVVRVGSGANLMDRNGRPMWRLRAGLLAAAGTRTEAAAATGEREPDELVDALRHAAVRTLERYVPFYERIAGIFGMRVRAGYQIEQFALLAACIVEGLALRLPFSADEVVDVRTPYSIRSGGPWSLFGVGVLGLIREFFEPDPDHPHPMVFDVDPVVGPD